MKVKEIIPIFRDMWIPVEYFRELKDKTVEVTPQLLKSLGAPTEVLKKFECMSLWHSNIRGIGPSKAVELWAAGVRPDNLSKHLSKLPYITQMWVTWKPMDSIPRETIERVAKQFFDPVTKKYELVGSYRRGKSSSGDIDALYYGDDVKALETKLAEYHGKNWIPVGRGQNKLAGIFVFAKSKSLEIDIWIADPKDKAPMLLYSTGSKNFNIRMRFIAIHRGYTLNQYGLVDLKTHKRIEGLKTERDYFEFLKMTYRKPEERN